MFLRQILSCYNLKTSFAKLVKKYSYSNFFTVLVLEYIFQYQYSYLKFFAVLELGSWVLDSITGVLCMSLS